VLSGEAENTILIVFGLTWPKRELTIYHTLEHASHYTTYVSLNKGGPSCPCSYRNWIHNYICNQFLSPLMLWVRISTKTRCTTLCEKVCQWLATGGWFSRGTAVSSTNITDRHDITGILLKVALNTIKQTNKLNNGTTHCVCHVISHGLVYYLIFKWWLRSSTFPLWTNIIQLTTSVSRRWELLWFRLGFFFYNNAFLSYMRVGSFLICGKQLHDSIISLRGDIWVHKTCLSSRLFIEVHVPS
jgi:hypothetical protein